MSDKHERGSSNAKLHLDKEVGRNHSAQDVHYAMQKADMRFA